MTQDNMFHRISKQHFSGTCTVNNTNHFTVLMHKDRVQKTLDFLSYFSTSWLIKFLALYPLCHSPGIPWKFTAPFIITAPTAD